jgi:DHA1 family tetracycline resistance protein-like MFS transporter
VLGGLLSHGGSFWLVGMVASGLSLANFILALGVLKESLPVEKHSHDLKLHPGLMFAGWDRAMKSGAIAKLLTVMFLANLTFTLWEATFVFFLNHNPHFLYHERAYGLILAFVGFVSAMIQGGMIRRLNKKYSDHGLLVTGLVLMAASIAVLPWSGSLGWLLTILFFWGVGQALMRPSSFSLLSKSADEGDQGAVLGVAQSVASLSRIVGPVLGGFLYDKDMDLPYWSGAGLILVGVLLIFSFKQKR